MSGMFTRIMAVVLAVILLLTAALSVISYLTMRDQRINARLDYLSSEAEDIASLSADVFEYSAYYSYWSSVYQLEIEAKEETARRHLAQKATKVNEEFGAYIAVVDRWGNVMSNVRTAYSEDPDFVDSLSGEEISEALSRVLAGKTIRVRSMTGGAPTFTVGVPFVRNNTVTGAVFIQTKAQRIQSGMEDLIGRVILTALIVLVLSALAVWLYVRGRMKPLGALAEAAREMGKGNFDIRVDETKGDRELRELSRAFNGMSEQLENVEAGRREFVANVSHELRSPITSIKGFAEGMADGVIPPEDHPKYLRLVADESNRLSRLVGELLELSRLERKGAVLEMTDFDINEMLRRAVIRRDSELTSKELDIRCVFQEDPCYVRADSARIEQVVINLLDNAIRFTSEGGKIVLKTERSGGSVRTIVRDNGIGVAPENREKIFERFFTEDPAHTSGKGTGLGLSICRRILEMHGREIRLLDTDEGAAFLFTLEPGEAPKTAGKPPEKVPEEMPEEIVPDNTEG